MGSVSEPFVFIDGPRPSEAEHIYDHYFSEYPTKGYDQKLVEQIQARRSLPNCQGSLFFDQLLNLALPINSSIDNNASNSKISPFYPPQQGKEGLCELIERISSSNFDRVRRTALIYYLMLDLDDYHGKQFSFSFIKQMAFPKSVCEGMKGYWHLDNGQFRLGISFLQQPDFVPRIAHLLSPLPSASSNDLDAQERAFAFTSLLKLINLDSLESEVPDIVEAITVSICWTQDIRAAWLFCRSMITIEGGEEEEKKMALCVARIVEFCFTPHPKPNSVKALIALPLMIPEEQMLSDIIINPPPNIQLSSLAHATAIDALLVRYINSGKYIDAIILDRKVNSSLGLMQLNQDASGSEKDRQKAKSLREKRQSLIKAAYSVLTRIERMMLELGDDFAEATAEDEEEAQGLEGSWERITPMADNTVQSIRSEHSTIAGPSNQRLTALTASPSLRSPAEPGSERSIDPLLTEVVRSSPARLRSRVSILGGSPRAANVSLSGASNMDIGSPRSNSFIGSPSIRRSDSLRKSIHSRQGTPSKSNSTSMPEDISTSMPLSSAKPYHLQARQKDAQNKMDQSFSSDRADTIGPDVGQTSLMSENAETTGPLSKLAQELEEELQRNQGSVDEILRRSITTNSMSPFRVISGSNRIAHSTLMSNKPIRRYEARYEIGSSKSNQEQDVDMLGKDNVEQEVQEPVRRRGGRSIKPRQRVPKNVSRLEDENVNDDGDTSVPGSFPGMQEDLPVKSNEQEGEVPKKVTRRSTKTQKKKQQEEDEDVVPEMEEISTAIRKSKSAASNLVGRPKASTPLRRSARLSVEPDAVHEDVISPNLKTRSNPIRQRSQRSSSPTKKVNSTNHQSTRKRRGTSQAPTELSEDENEEEEQGIATRSRRKAAASGMPGGF